VRARGERLLRIDAARAAGRRERRGRLCGARHRDARRARDPEFRALDIVRVDKHSMQFLYREGENFVFMDNESFEQIELTAEVIGDGAEFLLDGMECDILFYDETRILGVEIPIFVELTVTEASTALRGDTATNVNKIVTLETGAKITVPAFINEGDKLRIDTRSGNYMERVK
jgi:elongation factor P